MSEAAAALSVLERLKIDSQITSLLRQRAGITPTAPMATFKMASIAGQLVALLRKRGSDLDGKARENKAFEQEPAEQIAQPRAQTAGLYDFDESRTHGQRKKDNTAALALLSLIDSGELDPGRLTEDQKRTLAKYSGTGGNLKGADGKQGSAYEYYTPKPIAEGMWAMLAELGFKGGKVLDPCAGVGIFGATAPASAAVEAVELNETSGRINQLVNGGPGYSAVVSPFEAVASRTEEEVYDAVVTNVPFGDVHDRGANRKIDPRYQNDPLETYFILRSLEKLKPGGLAAFVVPPRVVSAKGGREEKLRLAASFMAEFMGAYRLPNSVFGTADADTITDVIVLRKFGRDAAQKIDELREQNPQALIDANVLWSPFVSGNYFADEGRRFVLGEFKAKDPSKFRDVDRVISDQSVANVAKLLRKFPGSRIDWKALNAIETEPIEYAEGDTITLAGQTLEMRDGRWVALGRSDGDDSNDALGAVLTSPLAAVSNAVNWEQASGFVAYLGRLSRDLELPVWLRLAHNDVNRADASVRGKLWTALCAGLAVVDVMQDHSGEPGFNYLDEYPVLSDAIAASSAVKAPTAFSRDSKAAFLRASLVYSKKDGFSDLWRGAIATEVDIGHLDTTAKVNALVYTHGTSIEVSRLKEVLGEQFDVMASDDWCIDAAGQRATKADDYYTGNLAQFLERLDAEIKGAEGVVREKLLRQRDRARDRVETVDPHGLRYNLFTPFVTIEEKAEFLRRFLNPAFAVAVNNLGEPYIVYEGPDGRNASTEQKLMSRIASYLTGNAAGNGVRSLSLQGKELGVSDREALEMMRKLATRLNTQFDGWTKSNPIIMDRMERTANDPSRLYFTEVDDTSPLEIPGMNPDFRPHGYQSAYVRKQARRFGDDILGFDVGLGKTFTALACVQYVQSIGVKKKTMFVVPNAVLSNWRVETGRAYQSLDDCLFIGLDINEKTGKASVDSSNYARDFMRVMENRHRKIFCTMEAFSMLPLKGETVSAYDAYLQQIDPSFAGSDRKADDERAASKRSDATGGAGAKSSAMPFFEDLSIDSLVLDEAHAYKNSKDTIEFSGAKFLSVANASARGLDAQIKAWFVRGLTPANDGVLPLTATPITNSPLEIYSMLTLAAGEKKVHDLCMGAAGADAFMDVMCMIEDGEDVGIDGTVKSYRIFTGLQNVELLRSAISQIATIRTAKDVAIGGDDLKLPDSPEVATSVALTADTKDRLSQYKMAYRAARFEVGAAAKDAQPPTPEEYAALEAVQQRFGEELELIGHPFNLIQKMQALIADPELDERATFYAIAGAQRDLAEAVIGAFNKLGKIEQRARPGPWTTPENVVGKTTVRDGGGESILVRVKVQARFTKDGRIVVDTTDYNLQGEFERIAEKQGLVLDCSIPPKLAAMLTNVKFEEANPRSASGRVKQLIFCDLLPMHNKIKRLLTKHAGIAAAAIAIVSGQSIRNPEQMQDIQDGFNAEGEDNRLRSIVANEKAEVGINLQKGTQAIHHLTIGWTPDSQHQRNGRGVRQGNTTARVNVYHYDADGTFDQYKRTLTTKKADWIGAVMDKQGGNEVQIAGGLSAEQYDELIESIGDSSAIQAIQDRAAAKERLARADNARQRQVVNLQTFRSQQQFLKSFPTVESWLGAKAGEAFDLHAKLGEMRRRSTAKMKAETLVRFESRLAEMQATLDGLLRDLDEAGDYRGYGSDNRTVSDMILHGKGVYGQISSKRRESVVNGAKYGKVKEGAQIINDWQSQVDQAKSMADEALKDFARIGEAGGGAYPARLAEAFREGKALLLDGAPVAQGMFIRAKDGELLIVDGNLQAIKFPYTRRSVADAAIGGRVIGFDSPDYEAAVAEAAALDDEKGQGVDPTRLSMLFSYNSTDVAERRKTETTVVYNRDNVRLPSPMFPYAIDPDSDGISEVLRDIANQQRAAILRWPRSGREFEANMSAGVVMGSSYGGHGATNVVNSLAGRMRADGKRVTLADVGICASGSATGAGYLVSHIRSSLAPVEGAAERFAGLSDRAAIEAQAKAIIEQACDWIIPWPGLKLADAVPYGMTVSVSNAYNEALKRADDAERAAAAAAFAAGVRTEQYQAYAQAIEQADGPFAPGMVEHIKMDDRLEDGEAAALLGLIADKGRQLAMRAVENVSVSQAGKVGLNGDTLRSIVIDGVKKSVKDFIKLAGEEAGSKAKWHGEQKQWDVTPAAYQVLLTKYAEAAKYINVVPAVE